MSRDQKVKKMGRRYRELPGIAQLDDRNFAGPKNFKIVMIFFRSEAARITKTENRLHKHPAD